MAQFVLFDLDGTLLQPRDPLHTRAFREALAEACGADAAMDWTGTSGMVDRAILAQLLQRAGMSAWEARSALTRACRQMGESYLRNATHTGEDHVMPGARALLERLEAHDVPMGLLTGNVGVIAWERVRRAGVRGYFITGAFGDEAMRRSTLVRRAIQRAQAALSRVIQASHVVVVGDTPRDVLAARRAGARCVAVATGEFSAAELRRHGAEAVAPDLTDTEAVVKLLRGT